jgi:hypothetical protein
MLSHLHGLDEAGGSFRRWNVVHNAWSGSVRTLVGVGCCISSTARMKLAVLGEWAYGASCPSETH